MRTVIISIIICIVLALPVSAKEMTCDECRNITRQIAELESQRKTLDEGVSKQFEKRNYKAVNKLNEDITNLVKQIVEHQKTHAKNCKDACDPEKILEYDVRTLAAQIFKLESENADKVKIDQLYKELIEKNRHLEEALIRKDEKEAAIKNSVEGAKNLLPSSEKK